MFKLWAVAIAAVLILSWSPDAHAFVTPADATSQQIAWNIGAAHWNYTPCAGNVAIGWDHLGDATNARSTWLTWNILNPNTYTVCSIVFSLDVQWTWGKYCTVMIHEMGHLSGQVHSDDPNDVMYPYFWLVGEHPSPISPDCLDLSTPKVAVKSKAKPKHRGWGRGWYYRKFFRHKA
jgi:hypothetical protein